MKLVASRMLTSLKKSGTGPGTERYERLLDIAESAIFLQLTRVSSLSCYEATTIIDILNRSDLLGQDRIDKLAGKMLDKAALDDSHCNPAAGETHRQTNDYLDEYEKRLG